MHLVDPVWLDTLADRKGRLRVEQLADLVTRHDVVIGELLDEELRLVGSGDGRTSDVDPHWTPRLAALDADQRETAHESVLRHAMAFGLVDEVAGSQADINPLLSVPGDQFELAVAQLTWTHRAAGAEPSTEALLLRPDAIVVHDEIDAGDGLHLLAFRSSRRAHALITAVLDVRTDASDDAPHPEAGRPHPGGLDAIATGSIASCRLTRGPVWRSDAPAREVTTHATADGELWLSDHRSLADPPPEPVRADVPTLRAVATELLTTT